MGARSSLRVIGRCTCICHRLRVEKARIRLNWSEDAVLEEGGGAFMSGVNVGDGLVLESVGAEEAEVVVLDANPN
jgi:hypothetical protein